MMSDKDINILRWDSSDKVAHIASDSIDLQSEMANEKFFFSKFSL